MAVYWNHIGGILALLQEIIVLWMRKMALHLVRTAPLRCIYWCLTLFLHVAVETNSNE